MDKRACGKAPRAPEKVPQGLLAPGGPPSDQCYPSSPEPHTQEQHGRARLPLSVLMTKTPQQNPSCSISRTILKSREF